MGINGIGEGSYPINYAAQKTGTNKAEESMANTSWTVKAENHSVILHGQESEEDGTVVTAWANVVGNTSMTVYQPDDFDPSHPVYKVKVWDANGKVTERTVDISEVDPENCDTIDMYAYSAYLSKSGKCPDALTNFIMTQAHHRDKVGNYGADQLFDKQNWLKIIKEIMEMQYDLGNLQGYLQYKRFLGVLSEEKEKKAGKAPDKIEGSKVETDIEVKPDGSRVLVMTRTIGGMSTTTSIELSKPTSMPNDAAGRDTAEAEKVAKGNEEVEKASVEKAARGSSWTVPDISEFAGQLFGE